MRQETLTTTKTNDSFTINFIKGSEPIEKLQGHINFCISRLGNSSYPKQQALKDYLSKLEDNISITVSKEERWSLLINNKKYSF